MRRAWLLALGGGAPQAVALARRRPVRLYVPSSISVYVRALSAFCSGFWISSARGCERIEVTARAGRGRKGGG
eukprot:366420-Chlamydomonas_euryale.AAC.2